MQPRAEPCAAPAPGPPWRSLPYLSATSCPLTALTTLTTLTPSLHSLSLSHQVSSGHRQCRLSGASTSPRDPPACALRCCASRMLIATRVSARPSLLASTAASHHVDGRAQQFVSPACTTRRCTHDADRGHAWPTALRARPAFLASVSAATSTHTSECWSASSRTREPRSRRQNWLLKARRKKRVSWLAWRGITRKAGIALLHV